MSALAACYGVTKLDHAKGRAMTEKFELGRLPGAIEATTLRQHFNLVARHARASRCASLRYARLEARGSPTPNQGFAALVS